MVDDVMAKGNVASNELDGMLENIKATLKSIVKQVQRSGSLEWYRVFSDANVQVLYSYAIDDKQAYMPEHIHYDSTEVFVIVRGKYESNGVEYGPGSTLVIPPGMPHCSRPLSSDLLMIVILYPPESIYNK